MERAHGTCGFACADDARMLCMCLPFIGGDESFAELNETTGTQTAKKFHACGLRSKGRRIQQHRSCRDCRTSNLKTNERSKHLPGEVGTPELTAPGYCMRNLAKSSLSYTIESRQRSPSLPRGGGYLIFDYPSARLKNNTRRRTRARGISNGPRFRTFFGPLPSVLSIFLSACRNELFHPCTVILAVAPQPTFFLDPPWPPRGEVSLPKRSRPTLPANVDNFLPFPRRCVAWSLICPGSGCVAALPRRRDPEHSRCSCSFH